jgi:hypothetical protein
VKIVTIETVVRATCRNNSGLGEVRRMAEYSGIRGEEEKCFEVEVIKASVSRLR